MTDDQIIRDRCPELAGLIDCVIEIRHLRHGENEINRELLAEAKRDVNAIRKSFLDLWREKEELKSQTLDAIIDSMARAHVEKAIRDWRSEQKAKGGS
jgi:hypothetical protein